MVIGPTPAHALTPPSGDLVVRRPEGLYCPPGDFYIDPWRPVHRAVITHAHADHARAGHAHYLCAPDCAGVLQARLGPLPLQTLAYGDTLTVGGVTLSLHPAGHVLGSAQVRLAHAGQVWVVSGDYKVAPDATCLPFEPVRCHCFITESTFGLPIYRWRPPTEVFDEINAWWRQNAAEGLPSLLLGYSFGKAQRLLAGVDPAIGPIVVHAAVDAVNEAYRASGVALPATRRFAEMPDKRDWAGALVLAPPSAARGRLSRHLQHARDGLASGWMQLRGARRRAGVDRGFVLSDHADWPGLVQAIGATGAERVIVTHGQEAVLVRWLQEQGLDASSMETDYGDEAANELANEPAPPQGVNGHSGDSDNTVNAP
ncbi:ligase-associated DNA damage response exonuclease [Aquabacterium fontiphilum]|uniref:ligase-associated DNA damage response exonuclease n=1 Tax=Aquabacterium fontiphilum TaxID=450365 RepID=UPI001376E971|nr:ligase-associated DNA damage response exonuclease [Aquabacterium fontiphilum]NBD22194.1 ligase-associated DNA damage response exonuclease [Aquabacterium fontiphilum]